MPASKRLAALFILAAMPLTFLPTGCFTSIEKEPEYRHGFSKREIRPADMPVVDSNGYYYVHHVYNYLPYSGEPDSMVGILKEAGLEMEEVWADTGSCFSGGREISPAYRLAMRTERDYGVSLYLPGKDMGPIMARLQVGSRLEDYFRDCDSGRAYFHYRSAP